jgi:hypothetical protein
VRHEERAVSSRLWDTTPHEAMEVFDFAVSEAAGNRTPDFMTASPLPLPRTMSALMIRRGRC